MRQRRCLIARVIVDYSMAAAVGDAGFAGKNIAGNHSAPDGFVEIDLWFVFLKFAAANHECPAFRPDSRAAFVISVPLHKGAIAEADSPAAGDFGNLIARAPKSAIFKSHAAGIVRSHTNHGWIGPVERSKFAIGNEQAILSAVIHFHRGKTIVGANAQKISIAKAGLRLDEFVADIIAETKCI